MEIDSFLDEICLEYQGYQDDQILTTTDQYIYSDLTRKQFEKAIDQAITTWTSVLDCYTNAQSTKNPLYDFLYKTGQLELKKNYETWLDTIQASPELIDFSKRHIRIMFQYLVNLQKHLDLFISIDRTWDRYFTLKRADLSMRSVAWSVMDFVLQYFFFDDIQFYMPHFFINMSYLTVDDFIDREQRSPGEKQQFVEYCTKRIMGFPVEAKTTDMKVANRLTELLEKDKPRFFNLHLYGNIMKMCTTEYRVSKAMKQIEKKEASDREYFENVLCKGATTMITLIEMMESKRVLPNQQLRIRELLDTREKKGFFIRWGFVAQLLDDMRDIVEDREVGTHTYINTRNATELETAVRGIFNFIVHHLTLENAVQCGFSGHEHIQESIEMMRQVQLLEFFYGLMKHRHLYRQEFIKEFEPYCLVSLTWFHQKLQYKFEGEMYNTALQFIDGFYRIEKSAT